MGKAAKVTAEELLQKFKDGIGTLAVGGSRFWTTPFAFPGTEKGNFINDFNALKSQLSLDAVKLLKGQGAVSDAERALLAQAVTKLNLSQSEDDFKKTLEGIIVKLTGSSETPPANTGAGATSGMVTIQKPDGTIGEIPAENLEAALKLGAKQI